MDVLAEESVSAGSPMLLKGQSYYMSRGAKKRAVDHLSWNYCHKILLAKFTTEEETVMMGWRKEIRRQSYRVKETQGVQ